ncbi:MAG: hypothetical protein BJ554DRAFT_196 [Olpidium bornovanus]|uniref:Uncharacterized protein n=1 Tax=Olpidium bornovanus TaxID=278681 RepID=A0A8H7ZU56_9FUNG|nr:MAG: hypothetical protein BJ554DRAFT_196 [Olpidium bornovanus]
MLTPRRSRLTRREGRPHCRNPFAEAAASSSSSSVSADAAAAEAGGPAFASAAAVESALAHLKANVYESIYEYVVNSLIIFRRSRRDPGRGLCDALPPFPVFGPPLLSPRSPRSDPKPATTSAFISPSSTT